MDGSRSGRRTAAVRPSGSTRGPGSRANNQLVYLDTIACRRPKEVTSFFKYEEDEKYNQQIQMVRNNSKNLKIAFRKLDPDSTVY